MFKINLRKNIKVACKEQKNQEKPNLTPFCD